MTSQSNRLLVLDFDGTSDDGAEFPGIHPEVQAVLERAISLGWRWVINSDRTRADLLRVASELPIELHPAALIAHQRTIDFADERGEYLPHKSWNEECKASYGALGLQLQPHIDAWIKEVHKSFDVRLDLSTHNNLGFVVHSDEVPALRTKLNTWMKYFDEAEVSSNHESCFIVHRRFCKGKATREVAHQLCTKRTHVAAIGDALNDLPMLSQETSGVAGCPASACPMVRRYVKSRSLGFVAQSDRALGTVEILNEWLSTLPIGVHSKIQINKKGDINA